MFLRVNLLLYWLLRRHPTPEMLQAGADLELSGFESRLVRLHTSTCKRCQEEIISAQETLGVFCTRDVPPTEVLLLRERIVASMSGVSAEQQSAINDVRRLLGTRAIDRFVNGRPTMKLRDELAAFVGHHAADTMLRRMAA